MTEKIWEKNEEKIIFVSALLEREHDGKLVWPGVLSWAYQKPISPIWRENERGDELYCAEQFCPPFHVSRLQSQPFFVSSLSSLLLSTCCSYPITINFKSITY